MKKDLTQIGLTPNEILVYQALAKLGGASSAGEIIKSTDLHRNIVYDSLSHLKNKKLVDEIVRDKKKLFILKNPIHLKTQFQKQLNSVDVLSSFVSSLSGLPTHEVTVYEGSVAWQEAWLGVMGRLKKGSVFYTLGMAGDPWVQLMGETFVKYEQWALENNVTDKIVSQKHLKKEIEAHQDISFREIRYIDIDLPVYTSIEIFEDRCFFENYQEPATLIEIKSKGLARSLKAYFDLLWGLAKK